LKTANFDIKGRDGRRKLPWALTERGAIQVANVANSPRAINLAVQVLRAFVRLREILGSNKDQNAPTTGLETSSGWHSHALGMTYLGASVAATVRRCDSKLERNIIRGVARARSRGTAPLATTDRARTIRIAPVLSQAGSEK
jgi:hypothetical protein